MLLGPLEELFGKETVQRWEKGVNKGFTYAGKYVTKHWRPMIAGGIIVGVPLVTLYVFKGRKTVFVYLPNEMAGQAIANNMNSLFGPFFSKQQLTLMNYTGIPGNPGMLTYWIEGQQVFPTQTMAAEFTGNSVTAVSRNVRGLSESVNGHHFVRVTA